jgi:hypothetical protein
MVSMIVTVRTVMLQIMIMTLEILLLAPCECQRKRIACQR